MICSGLSVELSGQEPRHGMIMVTLFLTRYFQTNSPGSYLYSDGKRRKMIREEKVQSEREKGKVRFYAK